MSMRKGLSLALILLALGADLSSQSLVELASKEKARRAKLKGKKSRTITNTDLKRIDRDPALIGPASPQRPQKHDSEASPAKMGISPRIMVTQKSPAPKKSVPGNLEQLKAKMEKAQERVELLTLKMNALMQQYYSMNDMTLKASLQMQIAETNGKLEVAKQEEAAAKHTYESARKR